LFCSVAAMVDRYSKLIPSFVSDFKNVGSKIAEACSSFYMPFIENRDVASLRTQGAHSLTLKPEQMSLPSEDPVCPSPLDDPNGYF